MDPDVLRTVVIATAGAAAAAWILTALVWRVTGTWERDLTDDEIAQGQRPERWELAQLGPMVTGRREVPGGYQELSGYIVGRTARLVRRDHGVESLTALGFPEPIAKQLDGEITARLKLRLGEGGFTLEGVFIPQKVEFTHRPAKVTNAYYLQPQPRRYRRVEAARVGQEAPRLEERAVDVEPA